ncbi:MAG: HDOD domain-containing protein [Deltaproteobacteria bacterium]|nr:HDOD domain-containing protein [Deltaproteobacteria bacterium]
MPNADQEKKIIDIMDRLHFFDAFTPAEKREIAGLNAHFRVYQAGEFIIREGSKGASMFILISGKVEVSKGHDSSLLIQLKPGDIFGEIAFLMDTDRKANIIADGAVIALNLDKKMMLELDVRIREKLKDKIIEKLIHRLEIMNNILFKLELSPEPESVSQPVLLKSKSEKQRNVGIQLDSESAASEKIEGAHGYRLKQDILKSVKELLPMPDILMKAQRLLADPASGPQDLAQMLSADQAIVARILKVANSAYYGFVGKISSIEKASLLFGSKRLGELITSMGMLGLSSKVLAGYEIKSGDLLQHVLATACGAKHLAEIAFPDMAEDAYIAGLLHDSGKIILDSYVQERKDRFKQYLKDTKNTFFEAEREIFGFDHGEIAAVVCKEWDIPEQIAQAICFHHSPSHPKSNLLAHLIHYADHLAGKTGLGACKRSASLKLDRTTERIMTFSETDYNAIVEAVKNDVNRMVLEVRG